MSRHVESFLEMMAVERGASAHTLAAYGRDLADFAAFLGARGDVLTATAQDLTAYMAVLKRRDLAPRTAARRVSCLRQVYRFLFAETLRADDPTAAIDAPKQGHSLPKYLTEAEVEALLAAARELPRRAARATALLELLYATGLRVSELVGLPLAAVRGTQALIVRGKGSKERMIPMGAAAREAIATYLAVRSADIPVRAQTAARAGARASTPSPTSPWLFPSGRQDRPHVARRFRGVAEGYRCRCRNPAVAGLAPRTAPLLRHPSPGPRRRPAQPTADVGPCRHFDDANIYARPRRTPAPPGDRTSSAGKFEIVGISISPSVTPAKAGVHVAITMVYADDKWIPHQVRDGG